MSEIYRLIMDPDKNPLSALRPAQRFQIMTYLGLMWTGIFCTAFGAWVWFGQLVTFHILVALGFVVTGFSFKSTQKMTGHRDHPRKDGTARYDDLWGA